MKLGLLERLKEYGESDFYPFHMPGHKRRELPGGFPDPYSIDITEIDGFDNLHHAEGILKESMEWAADVYGADRTYYLVNGSTCGILSGIFGCTRCGGRILMARNCHKAAYHGLILNRLVPEYIYPRSLSEYGMNGGIDPEDVRRALKAAFGEARVSGNGASGEAWISGNETSGGIQAVLVVSPTYEGIVSDIRTIAGIVHEYGIPLIVDEAHGAHLPFAEDCGGFPESALALGADVVIQSLHKTLPSFTQTAVLHIKGELADRERIERYLGMFQSSSPSYIFMAAMERCIRFMDGEGRAEMKRYRERLDGFYRSVEGLRNLKVLGREIVREKTVYDWDPSKIVVLVRDGIGVTGEELGKILRETYHLEMEMCAPGYVIGMTSLMDTEDGFKRFSKALWEIDEMLMERRQTPEHVRDGNACFSSLEAIQAISPAEAEEGCGKRIPLPESAGMISKEFIYLYPPGIPILAPGEQVTDEILARVKWYEKNGFAVQGLSDSSLSSIITVAKG